MSRPKLLERFDGYVADLGDTDFYLINQRQGEQMQIPLANLDRVCREHIQEGSFGRLMIYENRISFRLWRKKWTAREVWLARKAGRRLFNKLRHLGEPHSSSVTPL